MDHYWNKFKRTIKEISNDVTAERQRTKQTEISLIRYV